MADDVLSPFPTRFRGYDRAAVDNELLELRSALDYAKAERDRAVGRVLAVESRSAEDGSQTSATVKWLIDTAEQDAERIRAAAQDAANRQTEEAEELLRHRVDLIEQAQHEADVCRAQAAADARAVVHEALDKANAMLRGLCESETALQELFGGGGLTHRMPPPRRSEEQTTAPAEGARTQQPEPLHHQLVDMPQEPQMAARPGAMYAPQDATVPQQFDPSYQPQNAVAPAPAPPAPVPQDAVVQDALPPYSTADARHRG